MVFFYFLFILKKSKKKKKMGFLKNMVFFYKDYDFRLILSRVIVHLTFSFSDYGDHNTRMVINCIKSYN